MTPTEILGDEWRLTTERDHYHTYQYEGPRKELAGLAVLQARPRLDTFYLFRMAPYEFWGGMSADILRAKLASILLTGAAEHESIFT